MPRGKSSNDVRDKIRGNASSRYREAWAEGGYNRENSGEEGEEDDEEEHGGPQTVRLVIPQKFIRCSAFAPSQPEHRSVSL